MPNGTLPFERVASIASLVLIQRRKSGNRGEYAASTAGRHCLLEAKFRELLPCAGFVRLGFEQWPISFTPSPKTATSSRWMISFFFSRCRRGQIFSEFRPATTPRTCRSTSRMWSRSASESVRGGDGVSSWTMSAFAVRFNSPNGISKFRPEDMNTALDDIL